MTSALGLRLIERLIECAPRLADRRLPPETVTVRAHAIEPFGVREAAALQSKAARQPPPAAECQGR
jgi:hypothetical protein